MRQILRFIAIAVCLLSVSARTQNLVPSKWKFHTGDSLAWADPKYDDSGWGEIATGTVWEQQGYPDHDGYAWYRTSAVIPSSLKKAVPQKKGVFFCAWVKSTMRTSRISTER